jgi:chromate reductase
LLAGHRGLLIATPEHNGGYTALLKNALDWMSRPNGFPSGKVAALISASPGLLGGVKSQLSLQIVLTKLGVHVIPDSFALGAAHQAFGAEDGLRDSNAETAVRGIGAALAGTLDKFAGFGRARSAA